MSDTGSSGDNKAQQDELNLDSSATALDAPEVENKPVTPVKRTPSKRLSAVERAQRESEELVKTMGGSLDIEGGRKTRSSTRGTPSRSKVVDTPPPTKKARATSGTPRRGKGRKLDTTENETKTTPEKISLEPESVKEEDESSDGNAAKTEEKITDAVSKATENVTPSAAVDGQTSPAKQDEKPEPMEVDGATKDETLAEPEHVAESAQITTESPENAHEGNSNESDKPVAEQQESSNVVDAEKSIKPAAAVEEANNVAVERKLVENSVGNNVDANKSEDKAISEVSPTIPPPVPPVTVAGNEHKAESNDFCEPKIASPPITANNEGATPQYCN